MELQFYGANCIRLTSKKAALTVDDNLAALGQKSVTKPGDIELFTGSHGGSGVDTKLVIDQPGEYEVSGISVQGIAARAHIDDEKSTNATMYKLTVDDIRVAVVGHIYPELSESQLEQLGTVDVLCVPVGGNGFTLDPVGALSVVKKIEPKIVIPTHYADEVLRYEVPQISLEEALKAMAMEPAERIPKLKLKAGELTDITQLIVIERQ